MADDKPAKLYEALQRVFDGVFVATEEITSRPPVPAAPTPPPAMRDDPWG